LEKKVIIVVRDKGIGMDKKTLAKIFSPFFSTKAGHLGLVLYVSKQIIASYGGEIAITSMVGKGTKAVINLPLR
jgi:signal transduction histidine kinase